MGRKHLLLLVVVAAFIAAAVIGGGDSRPSSAVGTAAEQAIAQAKAEGQPVLISFRSDSCIPCQAMGLTLMEVKPRFAGRVAFVDVSLEPDTPDLALCQQYRVRVKPTTVFLGRDGQPVGEEIGALPAVAVAARLDELLR